MNKPETVEFGDELALLASSAASFCDKDAPVSRLRALRGQNGGFDRALWQQMAELGWTAVLVPEDRGGLGLDVRALGAVVRELGKVAAPEPLVQVAGLSARLLSSLESSPTSDALLDGLVSGELLVVTAWQAHPREPTIDWSMGRAQRVADGCVLTLNVHAIPSPEQADVLLVPALLDNTPALFALPRELVSAHIRSRAAADGTSIGTLETKDLHVAADALIAQGENLPASLTAAVEDATLLTAAYLVGLTEACFELTLRYLNTRQQFGKPIGAFQALQHRAVNLKLQCQLAAATLAEAMDAELRQRTQLIHRAKFRATEAAFLVTRDSIQLHGAIGFTDECDVGSYVNRALVQGAAFGNGACHARHLSRLASTSASDDAASVAREVTDPADGNWNALTDDDFRHLIRAWFEGHYPEAMRYPPRRLRWQEVKPWYLALGARGWLAPAWPREHGGMGLDASKLLIFIEEQERHGVARAPDMGLVMVGPLLIKHGTPEQQARYLPKILSGEHIWCQGYSEPNSGSDLASLRTEAVLDGDHFILNGQKTWTTLAQDATHMFVLARTDKAAKKQAGISFILLDMSAPGITVRPIRNIAGNEEFCEVFLDNVRVPTEGVVGGLNQGWGIAKALLSFERIFLGSPKQSQYALQRVTEIAQHLGLFEDGAFLDKYTRLRCDVMDLETYYRHFAAQVRRGETLGPDVSMLKVFATETYARLTELLIDVMGTEGAVLGKHAAGAHAVDVLSLFYTSRPATIYGGSNEIQRNIVSKAVLGLPD
jgi:alkylation response protein AidB-like acyl-CoA dehydrogenase